MNNVSAHRRLDLAHLSGDFAWCSKAAELADLRARPNTGPIEVQVWLGAPDGHGTGTVEDDAHTEIAGTATGTSARERGQGSCLRSSFTGKVAYMTTRPEEMAAGLSPYEAAVKLRDWAVRANSYSRTRKTGFRALSSGVKILSLVLSGSATIILGLQHLSFWPGLGFSLVALLTVVNAVEPFFNWRSRWILAEEAQHRFYRIQEDLEYLVATKPRDGLKIEELAEFYERYQAAWNNFSEKWLEFRRQPGQVG